MIKNFLCRLTSVKVIRYRKSMSAEFCEKIFLESKQMFSLAGVINKYPGDFSFSVRCLQSAGSVRRRTGLALAVFTGCSQRLPPGTLKK